jgi:hypothetical protein
MSTMGRHSTRRGRWWLICGALASWGCAADWRRIVILKDDGLADYESIGASDVRARDSQAAQRACQREAARAGGDGVGVTFNQKQGYRCTVYRLTGRVARAAGASATVAAMAPPVRSTAAAPPVTRAGATLSTRSAAPPPRPSAPKPSGAVAATVCKDPYIERAGTCVLPVPVEPDAPP